MAKQVRPLSHRIAKAWKFDYRPYWKVMVVQLLCVIYILCMTFAKAKPNALSPIGYPYGLRDPVSGNIIDPFSEERTEAGCLEWPIDSGTCRPVIAIGGWQLFCLGVSRFSAFSSYPVMVLVFLTKCKALCTFFAGSPLIKYINFLRESHEFHVYSGHYIAFDVWLHTLGHLCRWGAQGNIHLLWTSAAGITGLIVVISTPLITFPMLYFRKSLSYEVRKLLHYLFYVFAIALCWHVPISGIPNGGFIAPVMGGSILLYTLDSLYVYFFMTESVETTTFSRIPPGMRISMPVSNRFVGNSVAGKAGYCYVNIPWINNYEWHAFSMFEDPNDRNVQQVFIMKNGNWTTKLHDGLGRNTVRPVWIQGPFPSPYSKNYLYDNQILVASGIGITPALSAINSFAATRRVNLLWSCRDYDLLEFILKHVEFDDDAWTLIFYTGKKPLTNAMLAKQSACVKIITKRPDLTAVIPNIVYSIESGKGLPEHRKMTIIAGQSKPTFSKPKENPLLPKGTRLKKTLFNFDLGEMDEEISDDEEAGTFETEEEDTGTHSFKPWEKDQDCEIYVGGLSSKVMKNWGMMYCGGSPIMIDILKDISIDYDIDLHIDSFAW
jgi:predicted ferric reductase